jgi:hypothetical protein
LRAGVCVCAASPGNNKNMHVFETWLFYLSDAGNVFSFRVEALKFILKAFPIFPCLALFECNRSCVFLPPEKSMWEFCFCGCISILLWSHGWGWTTLRVIPLTPPASPLVIPCSVLGAFWLLLGPVWLFLGPVFVRIIVYSISCGFKLSDRDLFEPICMQLQAWACFI